MLSSLRLFKNAEGELSEILRAWSLEARVEVEFL